MYTDINYKTKKEMITAVKSGKRVSVHQPGGMFMSQQNGTVCIEGPHGYHKWYATAVIKDCVIVSVK